MRRNAGKGFPMNENKEILQIDSPRKNVFGPWLVVHKDVSERWAIVVLHWKSDGSNKIEPCLGIRWFYGNQGTPSVRSFATWLIIPNQIADAVLSKLPLAPQLRQEVNDILLGKYSIAELTEKRNNYLINLI